MIYLCVRKNAESSSYLMYLLHCSRYTGIREEMMDGIGALVEVNSINLDINNHRHTLLYANSAFDDDVNQSIFNLVESQRF